MEKRHDRTISQPERGRSRTPTDALGRQNRVRPRSSRFCGVFASRARNGDRGRPGRSSNKSQTLANASERQGTPSNAKKINPKMDIQPNHMDNWPEHSPKAALAELADSFQRTANPRRIAYPNITTFLASRPCQLARQARRATGRQLCLFARR